MMCSGPSQREVVLLPVSHDKDSPPTSGHDKSNVVAGCVCAYCLWRRAKNRVRDRRRRAGINTPIRSTGELIQEVMRNMGMERFEAMGKAMERRA